MKYVVIGFDVYRAFHPDGLIDGSCVASCTSKEAAQAAARLFSL